MGDGRTGAPFLDGGGGWRDAGGPRVAKAISGKPGFAGLCFPAGGGSFWEMKTRSFRFAEARFLAPVSRFKWLALVLLGWGFGVVRGAAFTFTLLGSNQLTALHVDHAPMGACSTMTYGYQDSACGVGTSSGQFPYYQGVGGVLVGLSNSAGLQVMPLVTTVGSLSTSAQFFAATNIQRTLTPGTDDYVIGGTLGFSHYSPPWSLTNLATAGLAERRRALLPATWLVFTINNTNSTPEDFYFGLPVAVTPTSFANGAYQGVRQGEAALAVPTGSCDLLIGARLLAVFNGMSQGFAFHLAVPAGQTRTLTVVLAYYRTAVVDGRTGAHYYYTSLFPAIDNVIDAAFAGFADAQARCAQLTAAMGAVGLNPYRRFLASHTLHSYMADTACLIDPQGRVYWWEVEGFFNYINTFDLTVDHAFFDSLMHPWALRNVLDNFSGALTGAGYTLNTPLYSAASGTQTAGAGFAFDHDMGYWPNSGTGPAYGAVMAQEELQSWILSAGVYWSRSGDNAWLTNNLAVLQACLNSMQLRDSPTAAVRDGVTKNVNSGEITTFDDLDPSLQRPAYSGRLAVRSWACYVALNAMFAQIGDPADAAGSLNSAGLTAQTIVNRWNTYHATLGYIPALLDGSDTAAITPMIEGLVYPAVMGLTNAVDRTGGPYAAMLQALSNHLAAVLVPGRCVGSPSGGWLMTSAQPLTWQSKIFICQYVAENVLGFRGDLINGAVDQIHASIQIESAPVQAFCDAMDGSAVSNSAGGPHYPRGVTTALWWLSPTNNPAYPVPTAVPAAPAVFTGAAGDRQVRLAWQGVTQATAGYNLRRATGSGGPYTVLTNGLAGAGYLDTGLVNGTAYYYVLTATNGVGESAYSPELKAIPVPAVATNLTAAAGAAGVTVQWPAAYAGWILQTNAAGLGKPGAWGDVPNATGQSQMSFPPRAPNAPAEFFRLRHP